MPRLHAEAMFQIRAVAAPNSHHQLWKDTCGKQSALITWLITDVNDCQS